MNCYLERAATAAAGNGTKERTSMNRPKWGFTLVELLVVIAIISILAAIVVPRVQQHILRARMVKAVAEIKSIETEMAAMLTHANKDRFADLFTKESIEAAVGGAANWPPPSYDAMENQVNNVFTDAFYSLLRQGRNADLTNSGLVLAPGVKEKLSTSYLPDLGQDPWGRTYKFFLGPWKGLKNVPNAPIPFRGYRAGVEDETGQNPYEPYEYDDARRAEANEIIPGNPPADGFYGYPAPKDMAIYVYSVGVNGQTDQIFYDPSGTPPGELDYVGGGDDINNWDGEQGWMGFYT